jgi:hypothetical protein
MSAILKLRPPIRTNLALSLTSTAVALYAVEILMTMVQPAVRQAERPSGHAWV